jgi:hypothetical protein
MDRKSVFSVILCFFIVFLAGCAIKPLPPRKPPLHVVLLPPANSSNDAGAPEMLRKDLQRELLANGYVSMDLEDVDKGLKELGITDGGQLGYLDQKKLQEKFGTELMIYGEVTEFFTGTAVEIFPPGVVYKHEIKAKFRMVNVLSDKVIWQKEDGVLRKDPLDKKKENDNGLLGNLLTNVVKDAVHDKMEDLSKVLARRIADSMPSPYYY